MILKAWTLQTHMLDASWLPDFNTSYLHIATFYNTKLKLLVFQDSILQQYDTTSLGDHILAFGCNRVSFFQGSKRSIIKFLVLQCLRILSNQLPSNAVLCPRRME